MRLIDADALLDKFEWKVTSPLYIRIIRTMIGAAPTIDAVPVKRGVWVTYTDGRMHCSNCSKIPINRIVFLSSIVYEVDIGSMMKYCPNCGARMDGEENG